MVNIMKTRILTKTQIRSFLKDQKQTGKTVKQFAEELNQPYGKVYGEVREYKEAMVSKDIMEFDLQVNQAKAMEVLGHKIYTARQGKMNIIRRIVIKHPNIKLDEAKKLSQVACSMLGMKRFSNDSNDFEKRFFEVKQEFDQGIIMGA